MHNIPIAFALDRLTPGLYMPLATAAAVCAALLLAGKIPLGYNLRNLAVRWRTTLLTAPAFTLVVGLMVVMLAFVHGMELFPGGRWISESGVRRLRLPGADHDEVAFEAVLGEGVAGELGKDRGQDQLHVGDLFDLGPRKWIVTGIMRSSGSTFASEIWAKAALVGPQFGKPNIFTSMALRTAGATEAAQLAASLKNYKKAALQAMTETEYFAKLSATNKQFLVAIIFVTVVMSI